MSIMRSMPATAIALLVAGVALAGCGTRDTGQPGAPTPQTGAPTTSPGPTRPAASGTTTPAARALVLTERGLAGIAAFGDPMDGVLASLRERLGPADQEATNENNPEANIFGVCPGARSRYVRWGRLWVLFTDGQSRYGQGRWHLFAYYVEGEQVSGRPDPATRRGIHVGSTVAELRAAYGPQLQLFPIEAPPTNGFRIGPPDGPAIDGLISSTAADGRVSQLHGGQSCGE